MGADELDRLHEHAGGAATGVIDPSLIRLQHLDQQLDHAARGVELAALFAFGTGKLRQKVFVNAAQHVLGPGLCVADLDIADEINELAEPLLVERRAGVVFGQHILEHRVVALNAGHGGIDELADRGLPRLGLEVCPACLGRHPENVLGAVLVRVLGVGALGPFGFETGVRLLEGVGYVFQEDETENDMLILRSVHAAAERVGHTPEFGLVAGCRALAIQPRAGLGGRRLRASSCHVLFLPFSSHRRGLTLIRLD